MKLCAARLIGPASLARSRRWSRVGGDGEEDAAVLELFEDEPLFASLWVTGQGAVGKAPAARLVDDLEDATGDLHCQGTQSPPHHYDGVLTQGNV